MTDKIYIALVENLKSYGPEHTVKGLKEYITKYNDIYFTRKNNARKLINEVHPFDVMRDILITTLKYEIIQNKSGNAREIGNKQRINHAIDSYQNGKKIRVVLNSRELNQLMCKMIKNDIDDTLNMLSTNPEIFDDYLALYINLLCNNRQILVQMSNDKFTTINEYFKKMSVKEKQK